MIASGLVPPALAARNHRRAPAALAGTPRSYSRRPSSTHLRTRRGVRPFQSVA